MNERIENVGKQFLSGVPVKEICFYDIFKSLDWSDQKFLIDATILHKLNVYHPLKSEYQVSFLKHIISELEASGTDEIHDQIYEQLAVKLEAEKPEFSFKHFHFPPNNQAITVKESNSFIRDGTTGLKLWPAAIALGEFILQDPERFMGKSILELGSGAQGFVGLTVIKACEPKKVFLSDCHETVLEHLIKNVRLNLKHDSLEVDSIAKSPLVLEKLKLPNGKDIGILNLPWEEVDAVKSELKDVIIPDILLATDVVYDDSIFDALLRCLDSCFKLSGPTLEFFLSQTIRNHETFNKFCDLLHQNNFTFIEESRISPKFLNWHSTSEIKIVRVTRKLCDELR